LALAYHFTNFFVINHNIAPHPRAGTRPAPTTHNHFNISAGVYLVPTLGCGTKHLILKRSASSGQRLQPTSISAYSLKP
jgi:hypothetical protein